MSIIEALGQPVKITAGAYTNIKVGWGYSFCWVLFFLKLPLPGCGGGGGLHQYQGGVGRGLPLHWACLQPS